MKHDPKICPDYQILKEGNGANGMLFISRAIIT